MTRKRNDSHSTEFGLWLREQHLISSKVGFVATNLDFVWNNYKTGEWMLLEEKRYMSDVTWSQKKIYKLLFSNIEKNKTFKGIHLVQFEKTSPEDGGIWLNRKRITGHDFMLFLMFRFDLLHDGYRLQRYCAKKTTIDIANKQTI